MSLSQGLEEVMVRLEVKITILREVKMKERGEGYRRFLTREFNFEVKL